MKQTKKTKESRASVLTPRQEKRRYSKWLPDWKTVFKTSKGLVTNRQWLENEMERLGEGEIIENKEKKELCLILDHDLLTVKTAYPDEH